MIKIILNNGETKLFNFPSFDKEKKFCDMWYSMQGEEKYADKKVKIITKDGDELMLKIGDIKDCTFDDALYCETTVREPELDLKSDQRMSVKDAIKRSMEQNRERKIEMLVKEIEKHGVTVDVNDPFFLNIVEKIEGMDDFKIPLLANMYCNTKSKSKY